MKLLLLTVLSLLVAVLSETHADEKNSLSRPFEATPQVIPGRIELERYDLGGEGQAYHDVDATNNGSGKLNFFDEKVLPLLQNRCYECHSHQAGKAKGGLVLDSRAGWSKGGELGAVIIPGQPDESLLITAVRYRDEDLQMPPKEALPAEEVEVLEKWIREGAFDPRTTAIAGQPGSESGPVAAEELWSFEPVANPIVPQFGDATWLRSDVDRYILSYLHRKGLKPLGDAAARTLIRRIHFDLIGLPPSVEAQNRWLRRYAQGRERAIAELIDELLETPQFGERWARHWLDTARYAESNGNNRNRVFRYAWRYRDWVIDALNEDMPYDQFLKEQLAGDLMPAGSAEERKRQRIATGFLAIGPKPYYPTIVPFDDAEPDRARYDWAAEQIDATMTGMMGLTVGCARCHDHKFDPIPTRDYYALAGIFRSTEPRFGMYYHLFGVAEGQAQRDFLYDWNLLVLNDEILPEIKPLQDEYTPLAMEENRLLRRLAHFPRRITNLEDRISKGSNLGPEEIAQVREEIASIQAKIEREERRLPVVQKLKAQKKSSFLFQVDQAMGVEDATNPSDVALRITGDHARTGPLVSRGFVSTLNFENAPERINNKQSGRLELAEWVAHPNNPLTPRVAVNRIWYHLFGRGIVNTLDNFGSSGEVPSHPELLDHLAYCFVHEFAWSQKDMIRYLMTSRVYQLTSSETRASADHFETDPENTLYWRMKPRRLEAEAIRDSMLSVSGRLNLERPQGSLLTEFEYHADIVTGDREKALAELAGNYRTIYVPSLRGHRHRLYDLFDYPDDESVNSARNSSTVPTQALYLLNNPLVMDYSASLATWVEGLGAVDDENRLKQLYERCYGRPPNMEELRRDLEYLKSAAPIKEGEPRWRELTQSILISSEFLFQR